MPGRRSTSCSDGPGRWSTPGRSKGRRRARRAEGGGREASRRGQLVNDRRGDRLGEGAGFRQPLLEFVAEGHELVDFGNDAALLLNRGKCDQVIDQASVVPAVPAILNGETEQGDIEEAGPHLYRT